ncbi:MAG: erythromycin esterase family protein [Chloroflexota bacterium]|nr:erythromycin esterase family protein [Chloroflexota bacterium]
MRRAPRGEPKLAGELGQQILTLSYQLGEAGDLDPLLDRVGDARFVLLGEASHGTHEYYLWRARITQRLIREKGFRFVAVEGDWPACHRVDRYVRGQIPGATATEVLADAFEQWPTWMWANWEIAALADWLRRHNDGRPREEQVGFFGLDVYSLWESLYAVIDYLKQHHPEAVPAAYEAFRCFEPFAEDPQQYARGTLLVPEGCRQEVLGLLHAVSERAADEAGNDQTDLNALMNAEALKGAEAYYRTMVGGGADSWNLRDRHMADTLDRLIRFHGPDAKAIVWEHNTHIGDARHTDMADEGMFNVGQLVRQEHEANGVVLVGFGSYEGTVVAGRSWDAPMQVMPVPPARAGSWEHALHLMDAQDRLLLFRRPPDTGGALALPRGHRAIGVVYHPEYEWGNYVPTVLPLRYDAFLYLDRTRALHPLHVEPRREPPDLYPWGV